MNAAFSSPDFPSEPVITQEGRFFRVSLLRHGRVESYLCETEGQARQFALLLAQPPVEPRPRAVSGAKPAARPATAAPKLSLVPTRTVTWKGPR